MLFRSLSHSRSDRRSAGPCKTLRRLRTSDPSRLDTINTSSFHRKALDYVFYAVDSHQTVHCCIHQTNILVQVESEVWAGCCFSSRRADSSLFRVGSSSRQFLGSWWMFTGYGSCSSRAGAALLVFVSLPGELSLPYSLFQHFYHFSSCLILMNREKLRKFLRSGLFRLLGRLRLRLFVAVGGACVSSFLSECRSFWNLFRFSASCLRRFSLGPLWLPRPAVQPFF